MKRKSVNGIILSPDKKSVLIVKRRDVPVWVLPGGSIDVGESPEQAMVREAQEETGCQIQICRQSGIYHPVNSLTSTTYVYVCEVNDGIPKTGRETREIDYYPVNHLPEEFFHVHKDFLKDALTSSKVVEKKLTQVTYFNLFKYFLKHPIRVLRFALSQIGLPINSTKTEKI